MSKKQGFNYPSILIDISIKCLMIQCDWCKVKTLICITVFKMCLYASKNKTWMILPPLSWINKQWEKMSQQTNRQITKQSTNLLLLFFNSAEFQPWCSIKRWQLLMSLILIICYMFMLLSNVLCALVESIKSKLYWAVTIIHVLFFVLFIIGQKQKRKCWHPLL